MHIYIYSVYINIYIVCIYITIYIYIVYVYIMCIYIYYMCMYSSWPAKQTGTVKSLTLRIVSLCARHYPYMYQFQTILQVVFHNHNFA